MAKDSHPIGQFIADGSTVFFSSKYSVEHLDRIMVCITIGRTRNRQAQELAEQLNALIEGKAKAVK